jgi:hypothetical protein
MFLTPSLLLSTARFCREKTIVRIMSKAETYCTHHDKSKHLVIETDFLLSLACGILCLKGLTGHDVACHHIGGGGDNGQGGGVQVPGGTGEGRGR